MEEEELLCVDHPIVEHKVKVRQTRRVLKCFDLGSKSTNIGSMKKLKFIIHCFNVKVEAFMLC